VRGLVGLIILLTATLAEGQTLPPPPPSSVASTPLHATQIHKLLTDKGIIVDSVSVGKEGDPTTVKVSPASKQSAAQPTIDAYDWSTAAAQQAQHAHDRTRAASAVPFGAGREQGIVLRAEASLLVDEINALRQWNSQLNSCIAKADSLTTLKTCAAALPVLAPRTLDQAVNALGNKITSGATEVTSKP
jgi:hypothetical protein